MGSAVPAWEPSIFSLGGTCGHFAFATVVSVCTGVIRVRKASASQHLGARTLPSLGAHLPATAQEKRTGHQTQLKEGNRGAPLPEWCEKQGGCRAPGALL